jgi:hypothetical protein
MFLQRAVVFEFNHIGSESVKSRRWLLGPPGSVKRNACWRIERQTAPQGLTAEIRNCPGVVYGDGEGSQNK